jgi:hypothetical protein
MARDAIARQYDVDKNSITLTSEPGKGGYRPGLITFSAKKRKSLDLDKIRESITATRLSGGTRMGMDYLEISVRGELAPRDQHIVLKVSGTPQEFVLREGPAKAAWQRLRDALARGQKAASVTGRVEGWSGRFPDVLRALAKTQGTPAVLVVTDCDSAKE